MFKAPALAGECASQRFSASYAAQPRAAPPDECHGQNVSIYIYVRATASAAALMHTLTSNHRDSFEPYFDTVADGWAWIMGFGEPS